MSKLRVEFIRADRAAINDETSIASGTHITAPVFDVQTQIGRDVGHDARRIRGRRTAQLGAITSSSGVVMVDEHRSRATMSV